MQLRKNIATSAEGFIFNPSTGDSFSANQLGSEIIGMLKEKMTKAEIVAVIEQKYDVDKTQLEKDMEDFAVQMSDYYLIEK